MASTAFQFTTSCNFSMNTKVRMVCGVNRNQAGVHPFIRNSGPSCLRPCARICARLGDDADWEADWRRDLRTSAGAQMVVATVPAAREASMCVFTSSWRGVLVRRRDLTAV